MAGGDPRQVRLQLEHLVRGREPYDGPAGPVVHPLVGDHVVVIDPEGVDDLTQVLPLDVPAATGGRRRERQQPVAPSYLDQAGIALLDDARRHLRRAAEFQPGVRRTERRVAREGQLAAWGEDPQPVVRLGRGSAAGRTSSRTGSSTGRCAACPRRRDPRPRGSRPPGCRDRGWGRRRRPGRTALASHRAFGRRSHRRTTASAAASTSATRSAGVLVARGHSDQAHGNA